ncbi:ProQ/FINO family protein, partial [Serratia fonticola]
HTGMCHAAIYGHEFFKTLFQIPNHEQWWPMLLEDRNPRLMKQGIRADFYQDIACRQLSVSHKHLRRCLKAITRSAPYLYKTTNGASRYDLLGNPCGIVTAEEHQYAREQLASLT